jgi:hypothetical protein
MRSQAEDEAMVLRRELDVQIMRFPTRVRQLSVDEFERDYAGNVMLASARKLDPLPPLSALVTPRGAASQTVAATPLSVRSQQKRRELTAAVAAKRPLAPLAAVNVAAASASASATDKASKDSAREQIRLLQEQLNGLMASLASPGGK